MDSFNKNNHNNDDRHRNNLEKYVNQVESSKSSDGIIVIISELVRFDLQ